MKLKKKTLKDMFMAVGIILMSTLPYFHDVITIKGEGLKPWVPKMGMVDLFTDSSGKIMGFSSYRVFLYYLFIHLFAHIGFVGWMMDAKGKSYRIALLVPVVLSGYTVALFLLNARATSFNSASTKFYLTIAVTIIVAVLYYIDHKNKVRIG
jgi:phosphoglycerol transferase MdoB-like AlkP superfamily enzyme